VSPTDAPSPLLAVGRSPTLRTGRRQTKPRQNVGGRCWGTSLRQPYPGSQPGYGLEEFDFDHARGLKRDQIAHLAMLAFVAPRRM
jgi:hypothetical protein